MIDFIFVAFLVLLIVSTCSGIIILFYYGIYQAKYVSPIQKGSSPSKGLKPKRIAFLHPDFGIGGAENLIVNAAISLQRKDHIVHIYTAHHDLNHCFDETRGKGPLAQCITVYGDWLPKTIFLRCAALCAYLRMLYITICIIIFHRSAYDAYIVDQVSLPIPFLRAIGKPVLFYGHYPDKLLQKKEIVTTSWHAFYRKPLDYLEEITTASASLIVVNSQFTKQVFQKTFPMVDAHQMLILYPPVDTNLFMTESEKYAKETSLFVSLNRFEKKKNVEVAIHALSIIKTRQLVPQDIFNDIKLIIAGGYDPQNEENHEYLQELQVLVDTMELKKHVEFQTSVSNDQKIQLLAKATSILYTPSNEHFGIVPVEAMASGTPVIASASGGPLESIVHEKTGFLCHERDGPSAFARSMVKLCGKDEEKKIEVTRIGQNGKKRASEMFSLDSFATTLDRFVHQITS